MHIFRPLSQKYFSGNSSLNNSVKRCNQATFVIKLHFMFFSKTDPIIWFQVCRKINFLILIWTSCPYSLFYGGNSQFFVNRKIISAIGKSKTLAVVWCRFRTVFRRIFARPFVLIFQNQSGKILFIPNLDEKLRTWVDPLIELA